MSEVYELNPEISLSKMTLEEVVDLLINREIAESKEEIIPRLIQSMAEQKDRAHQIRVLSAALEWFDGIAYDLCMAHLILNGELGVTVNDEDELCFGNVEQAFSR